MDETFPYEQLGFQNLQYLEEHVFNEPLPSKPLTSSVEETYRRFGHQWATLSPIHPQKQHPPLDARLGPLYSGFVGVEFSGLVPPEVEAFLIEKIESKGFSNGLTTEEKKGLLDALNESELFETFLHVKFPGQKRFSLEGAETLIPMMKELVKSGEKEVVIGMAHRGRLNVLSNILKKSYSEIFEEFHEGYVPQGVAGDVKYHLGYKTDRITLLPNPSHLESVYPVLEGYSRGKIDNGTSILPIIIHGDGALAGQGVVYETMQFSNLPGYTVHGSIHLIINNQISFTTLPEEERSTPYCTDIAKAFGCPVFHINGDHPEEAIVATRLALEVKERFGIDVFLDLVCYRKYGHNEGDEPAFTQPIEYQVIRSRKSVRELYRDQLIKAGELSAEIAKEGEEQFKKLLSEILAATDSPKTTQPTNEKQIKPQVKGLSKEELKELAKLATTLPTDFSAHSKIAQGYQHRREAVLKEQVLDWGTVEMLTYASLLKDGVPIRLTGQDVGRGTFSHRQLRLNDQKSGRSYFPLQHLFEGQPRFDLINSPLSEFASVGFEYGYSVGSPKTLVIWEAQFGDFANGAQVMYDQYLSAGERKWGQYSSLVLFLPHGFEGQGPEHSSGRLERYLALAAEDNFRVVYPTLPAQLYHLLREQAVSNKPLVVMTPKGLLRHPKATSTLDDLVNGSFKKVLLDKGTGAIHTLVFLSGRFFIELEPKEGFAFLRVEQLYPFPKEEIEAAIKSFPQLKRAVWCQEEPQNMGAWTYVKGEMPDLIYVGRARHASPACGSHKLHEIEEEAILNQLWSFT